MQEMLVLSLGQEGPLKEEMATSSSILGFMASIEFDQRPIQGQFPSGRTFFGATRLTEGLSGRKCQGVQRQENQEWRHESVNGRCLQRQAWHIVNLYPRIYIIRLAKKQLLGKPHQGDGSSPYLLGCVLSGQNKKSLQNLVNLQECTEDLPEYCGRPDTRLLNCGVGEDSWESLGLQEDTTSQS